jgi:ABC-type transport system involved in cytochrome c biogenesis ATPase subunit
VKETYTKKESVSQIQKCVAESVARNQLVHVLLGQLDATDQKRVFVAPCTCIVRDAWLTTETALAIDGTNYRSFQLTNVTDSEDLLASAKTTFTGGTAITADTPYDLTPDQNNKLQKGDVLELVQTKTASPTALEECSVTLAISYDDDDEA